MDDIHADLQVTISDVTYATMPYFAPEVLIIDHHEGHSPSLNINFLIYVSDPWQKSHPSLELH